MAFGTVGLKRHAQALIYGDDQAGKYLNHGRNTGSRGAHLLYYSQSGKTDLDQGRLGANVVIPSDSEEY